MVDTSQPENLSKQPRIANNFRKMLYLGHSTSIIKAHMYRYRGYGLLISLGMVGFGLAYAFGFLSQSPMELEAKKKSPITWRLFEMIAGLGIASVGACFLFFYYFSF